MLEVCPKFLTQPLIHFPLESREILLDPARPVSPFAVPWELKLHPSFHRWCPSQQDLVFLPFHLVYLQIIKIPLLYEYMSHENVHQVLNFRESIPSSLFRLCRWFQRRDRIGQIHSICELHVDSILSQSNSIISLSGWWSFITTSSINALLSTVEL